MPEPIGPFCESNESKSLKPGGRSRFGPALSPGSLFVKVFGFLIVVLVANSVPVNAGCGRPEVAESVMRFCSRVAFGLLERVCALVASISFMTELAFASTCGLSGRTSRVSSGNATLACTSCNSWSNDFFSSGSCTSVLSGSGFAAGFD